MEVLEKLDGFGRFLTPQTYDFCDDGHCLLVGPPPQMIEVLPVVKLCNRRSAGNKETYNFEMCGTLLSEGVLRPSPLTQAGIELLGSGFKD